MRVFKDGKYLAQVLFMTLNYCTHSRHYQLITALWAQMQPELINCIWHMK